MGQCIHLRSRAGSLGSESFWEGNSLRHSYRIPKAYPLLQNLPLPPAAPVLHFSRLGIMANYRVCVFPNKGTCPIPAWSLPPCRTTKRTKAQVVHIYTQGEGKVR